MGRTESARKLHTLTHIQPPMLSTSYTTVVCITINEPTLTHHWASLLCVCSVTSVVFDSKSGKNTGVGCYALLQGIFPTQESNLSLTSPALAWGFFATSAIWEAWASLVAQW